LEREGNLKWAITGRSLEKLNKVKIQILSKYSIESLDCIVADTSKFDQVEKVVNQTKVVISTVGPYNSLGNELVNACALYGTDYVDITGEAEWVQTCIKSMQDLAVNSGARIVSFCGHDSVPYDLCTYFMQKEFKTKHGQDLKDIRLYNQGAGNVSGSTIISIFDIMDLQKNRGFKPKFSPENDPWYLAPSEDSNRSFKTLNKNTTYPHYDFKAQSFCSMAPMGAINYKVVERTNTLNGYGDIEYGESTVGKNWSSTLAETFPLLILGCFFMCKPLGYLAKKFLLPKQGSIVELAKPEDCFLNVWAVGTGTSGKKLYNEFHLYADPGYVETSRMLAESGLCFVFNDDKIKVGGGFWTPGSALNETLLERLQKSGKTDFCFYDPKESISGGNDKKLN